MGLGVLDMIDQMGLGIFVEMGLGVLGVIDMIDRIYDSYYSSTRIYRSTHVVTCFFFKVWVNNVFSILYL